MSTRTHTNFWLNVASLAVMLGLAATGGILFVVLPPGSGRSRELLGWSRHDIGQVHSYLAVAVLVLLTAHVMLHWGWACAVFASVTGRPVPTRRKRITRGLAFLLGILLLLSGGLW